MPEDKHKVESRRDEQGFRWSVCVVCGEHSAEPSAVALETLPCPGTDREEGTA